MLCGLLSMVTEGQDVKTVIYAYLILGFQGKHNYLNSVIYQKKNTDKNIFQVFPLNQYNNFEL